MRYTPRLVSSITLTAHPPTLRPSDPTRTLHRTGMELLFGGLFFTSLFFSSVHLTFLFYVLPPFLSRCFFLSLCLLLTLKPVSFFLLYLVSKVQRTDVDMPDSTCFMSSSSHLRFPSLYFVILLFSTFPSLPRS